MNFRFSKDGEISPRISFISTHFTPTPNVRCKICGHWWYADDPLSAPCPNCSKPTQASLLSNIPVSAGAPINYALPSYVEIHRWLIINYYTRKKSACVYEKVTPYFTDVVTDEEIIDDPIDVIITVKALHDRNKVPMIMCDDFKKYFDFENEYTEKIEIDKQGSSIRPDPFYCNHEKGETPLRNKKNELWIICKKCGKDLELLKK